MDKKDASFNHGSSVNYNALTTLSLVGDKCALQEITAAILLVAFENSWHFAMSPLVSLWNDVWGMNTELWCVTTQIWVVTCTSAIQNFSVHFWDILLCRNWWWHHKMLAVFLGYIVGIMWQPLLLTLLNQTVSNAGYLHAKHAWYSIVRFSWAHSVKWHLYIFKCKSLTVNCKVHKFNRWPNFKRSASWHGTLPPHLPPPPPSRWINQSVHYLLLHWCCGCSAVEHLCSSSLAVYTGQFLVLLVVVDSLKPAYT